MIGMSPWNPPNHNPIISIDLKLGVFMANPLQIDTAKASIAKPTAMRMIDSRSMNKAIDTVHKTIIYACRNDSP